MGRLETRVSRIGAGGETEGATGELLWGGDEQLECSVVGGEASFEMGARIQDAMTSNGGSIVRVRGVDTRVGTRG